jgi:hypothetical protein
MVNKEKYELKRKEYNADKTFVQISKELHKKIKEHCKENGLKIKEFLEEVISKSIS